MSKKLLLQWNYFFIFHGTTDKLANSNRNNLSSQMQFSVTAHVFWLHKLLEEYSVWISPLDASSAVSSQVLSDFHLMP